MGLDTLKPGIARFVIDETKDQFVDVVEFGEGDPHAWIATTFVRDDVGVVIYSDGTDHTEAWQGNHRRIKQKTENLIRSQLRACKRAAVDPEITYKASHDPLIELPDVDPFPDPE